MFWRVPGYTQPSPLEAILDMEGFTLEEVLDEADLIQECKSLNGRLVNFLKEPATLESLLSYLVDSPGAGVHYIAEQLSHGGPALPGFQVAISPMYSCNLNFLDVRAGLRCRCR
jgi:hypothetical protein